MQRVISILDEHNLVDFDGAQRFVLTRDPKELASFAAAVDAAINSDSRARAAEIGTASLDSSNFLPSSSLRGDSGCIHWNCRLPKVRVLARYAALYCDKVILPLRVRFSEKNHAGEFLERLHLFGAILGLIELRPLIESGIIFLVPDQLVLCRRHWDEAVPQHQKIARTAEKLAKANVRRFKVTYTPPAEINGQSGFDIKGPVDYLDHGSIHRILETPPDWMAKRKIKGPVRLSEAAIRRHKIVVQLFRDMVNDAFLQSYFTPAFNARYVTNMKGEAEFFRMLHEKDELARQTAALCARMTHSVPLFTEAPLTFVLKLRREEPEAFQNYKTTLTGIVKNHVKGKTISDSEARDLYLDILKPELDALEAKAANVKRSQMKVSLVKAATATALVGLGIYSGVLPNHLADLVKTIGGFSVAKDLTETLVAAQGSPTEVRNHNLYFLLRLRQQSNKTRGRQPANV